MKYYLVSLLYPGLSRRALNAITRILIYMRQRQRERRHRQKGAGGSVTIEAETGVSDAAISPGMLGQPAEAGREREPILS